MTTSDILRADDDTDWIPATRTDIDAKRSSLIAAAEGAVLTHVVTPAELDAGALAATDDLALWARVADGGVPFADGGVVKAEWGWLSGTTDTLSGPAGWLDAFEPGELIGLRMRGGTLHLECPEVAVAVATAIDAARRDETSPLAALREASLEAAGAALRSYVAGEGDAPQALLEAVVAGLVTDRPGCLDQPVPPLGACLRGMGLDVEDGFVGLPGSAAADDLDEGEFLAVLQAEGLLWRLVHTPEDPLPAEVLCALLDLLGVRTVVERLTDRVQRQPLPPEAVVALTAAAGDDEQRGHALLLAARSAQGRGDEQVAERLLDEAVRLHPLCEPIAFDTAEYAAARGDAVRADSLLRKVGVPVHDPMRRALKPLLAPPDGVVSRNRPCPCGSGRKYKVCCLRHVVHPLATRAPLAYARVVMHAQRPSVFDRGRLFVTKVGPGHLLLAMDLAVFEDGALEDYLATRSHLLREDERELLESWRGIPLAAYEVDAVQRGRSVTMRPLADGEPIILRDRALSMAVEQFDVRLARILPGGDGPVVLSPPAAVHPTHGAALVELLDGGRYDPQRVAEFFGPLRSVKLRNRDEEDYVLCEVRYDVADTGAWGRLPEHLGHDHDDEDSMVLVGRPVENGEVLLRGSVHRDGQRWTVQTNSRERLAELRQIVQQVAPDAVLVEESVTPGGELLARAGEMAAIG